MHYVNKLSLKSTVTANSIRAGFIERARRFTATQIWKSYRSPVSCRTARGADSVWLYSYRLIWRNLGSEGINCTLRGWQSAGVKWDPSEKRFRGCCWFSFIFFFFYFFFSSQKSLLKNSHHNFKVVEPAGHATSCFCAHLKLSQQLRYMFRGWFLNCKSCGNPFRRFNIPKSSNTYFPQ